MQPHSENAITVRKLTKKYRKACVVCGLSFEVARGSVTGFLGPNGAGKTTTIRMILGLVQPDEGAATILGQPYRQLAQPMRLVGAMLDGARSHPWRSARDHLRILASLGGLPAGRVDKVLDLVELTEHAARRVSTFSLGMRQRLGIATALLGDPAVLIFDEPANGLDATGVRWLRALLRSLADEGRAILVSSHILTEIAQMADCVLIISRGRLVAQSSLEQLRAEATSAVRIRSSAAQLLFELLKSEGITAQWLASDRIRATGTTTLAVSQLAARHGIPLLENSAESHDLEHVFFELTEGKQSLGADEAETRTEVPS